MKRSAKESFVTEFQAKVAKSPIFYLTDFTGLSVKSMTRLRHRLSESGAEYIVVKNRLVLRALQEMDLEIPDMADHLKGPTGVIMVDEDPVAPAKALSDFAKENDNRPVFKVGVLDMKVVEAGQFDRLAKLPPKEQLLAELAGAMEAPLAAFVGVLEAKLQETAGLIESLRNKKAEEA